MESGYPCEHYIEGLQVNEVDGLFVRPDSAFNDLPTIDYSQLTLDQIIWLQQQDQQNLEGLGGEGRYCPRGLENQGARPDGITPCPFLDRLECGHAFSEYTKCPTVRRREGQDLSQYGDTNYWEY